MVELYMTGCAILILTAGALAAIKVIIDAYHYVKFWYF
ncbi:hypothetical protein M2323_004532 [Rhodoblastus acidophilus]|nr:hypothetical protein [Rhodoblastus acidophilus]MCW2335582.1 hypothetical protein [Rhodoblastus acidophilus]